MQPPARRSRLFEILEKREEQAAVRSIPNTGAEDCLKTLKEKGIPFGIFSSNNPRSVLTALKSFGVIKAEDFHIMITREDVAPKPHPEGVYLAADRMDISTSELMVVGDFQYDVLAGSSAGAFTVLLTNNGRSFMDKGYPEPDRKVDRLCEILKLI